MSATRKGNQEGGIKGFLTRAGKSFYAGGLFAKEKAWTVAQYGGRFCFVVATTSIVVLMPLIFEIMREGQVRSVSFYAIWHHRYYFIFQSIFLEDSLLTSECHLLYFKNLLYET